MDGQVSTKCAPDPECSQFSNHCRPTEATIRALEQQVSDLDEAHYEALREARDASRRAAELRLQAIEARMRHGALVECEPINVRKSTEKPDQPAVLRLAHIYFDEPGKYRLVLNPYRRPAYTAPQDTDEPVWCSRVVYDASRPDGKSAITIPEAVRAAYKAAEQRGYRLVWGSKDG